MNINNLYYGMKTCEGILLKLFATILQRETTLSDRKLTPYWKPFKSVDIFKGKIMLPAGFLPLRIATMRKETNHFMSELFPFEV